jgi:DHA2 family multidrug resistance protein
MARIYQCIGMPLFFVPLNTIAYSDLPPGKSNNASALMNLMRNLGGGVGISVAITLLERRAQMHTDRLVSHTSMFDPMFRARLANATHMMLSRGFGPAEAHTQALVMLNRTVQQQAMMNSYLDVFKVMAIGCLSVVGLVLFLRKINRGDHGPAAAH